MVKSPLKKSQQDVLNEALARGSSLKKGGDSLAQIKVKSDQSALPSDAGDRVLIDGRLLQKIDISKIDANPFAPRTFYSDQMLKDMADSLAVNGQQELIHVCVNPSDKSRYVIADGWTRVQAAQKHGPLVDLLAEVHDLPVFAAAWFG